MNCAPIIIPAMSRYTHLKNCIDSLLLNNLSEKTDIFIGLDYPPAQKYVKGYNKVREYLKNLMDSGRGYKSINIIERTYNMGVIENTKDLIRTVIKDYDTFIFSDDDNTFSPCFLEYINNGLEKYKNDKNVLSIAGYSYPVAMPESEHNVIKMQRYYSDWGYGMWKDRYIELRDTITQSYFDSLFRNPKLTKKLREKSRKNYVYAFGLCSPSDSSRIRPYDWTNSIYQILNDRYSIMPKVSLVKNNGWDGSGIHCQDSDPINVAMKHLFINQKISEEKSFDTFSVSDEESDIVNKKCDESLIGAFDKAYYKKVRIKEILFRYGILDKVRTLLRKK